MNLSLDTTTHGRVSLGTEEFNDTRKTFSWREFAQPSLKQHGRGRAGGGWNLHSTDTSRRVHAEETLRRKSVPRPR